MTGEHIADFCNCGHEWGLHDRFGCAAFLGAFAATAERKSYCACKRPRNTIRLPFPVVLWTPRDERVAAQRC